MPTSYTTYGQSVSEWIERNPLRAFRRSVGARVLDVAILMGVSTTTVSNWETGASKPSDENMQNIGMYIENKSIDSDWEEWANSAPQMHRAP